MDNANSTTVPKNAPASESARLRLRHSSHATIAVTIGTGASSARPAPPATLPRLHSNVRVMAVSSPSVSCTYNKLTAGKMTIAIGAAKMMKIGPNR
jgi:hypothetical protein